MTTDIERDRPLPEQEAVARRRLTGALALIFLCLATLALALPLSASGRLSGTQIISKAAISSLPPAPRDGSRALPYETGPSPQAHEPATSGGPDQYGYVFLDEQEPGGPVYSWQAGTNRVADSAWQKINDTGATPQDDGVITDSLPFSFSFYGSTYNSIHISTNGNLHFGPPNDWFPGYRNLCPPSADDSVPQGMIAPLWYDFVVPSSTSNVGGVYTTVVGTAPSRTYIVEWRHVNKYQDTSTYATFEALLDESGNIRFQYREIVGSDTGGFGGAIGIQNINGTIGLVYSCHINSVFAGRAILFRLRQAALFNPSVAEQGGAPGSTIVYNQTLLNRTGIDNSFAITTTGNVWTTTVQPATTGVVSNGASVPVTISVQIPASAHLHSSDSVTVSVSSALPSPGAYTATAVLTTSVSSYGADFIPPEQTQSGDFGTTLTYTTLLTNTSPVTNQFDLSARDNQWPTTVSPTETGSLAPHQSTTVLVSVHVPQGSTLGDSDQVAVTAQGVVTTPTRYVGFTALTTTAGIWSDRQPMPVSRSRGAGVYFPGNGKLYAIGGSTAGSSPAPISEYDPASDSWQTKVALPIPVTNVGAAVIGNAIYIPGGYNPLTAQAVSVLQVYYPLQNQVLVLSNSDLPAPRMGSGVAAANGKLYVVGGADSSLVGTSTVYEYNPNHAPGVNGWVRKADMRNPRVYLAAATVDNIVYAAGGMPGAPTDLDVVEKFNPVTNSWQSLPPMNYGRAGLAVVGIDSGQQGCGGRLYAIGGGWNNYTATVETYDATAGAGGSWRMASSLVEPRRSLGAAYNPTTHRIYAFGGWNDNYEVLVESAPCSGGPFNPPITPTPSATPCPMNFSDVHTTDYFYQPVQYLYCEGAISGYGDGTFRPYAYTTRGQLSKIVVNAEGWPIDTSGGPHFSDVPASNPFYPYIETAYHRGVISGYSNGTFLWGNNVTRGQLSKIVVIAEGWPVSGNGGPHFSDVPPDNPFYAYVETAFNHAIISGYSDGTFHPGLPATRGQISKIVYNAVTAP